VYYSSNINKFINRDAELRSLNEDYIICGAVFGGRELRSWSPGKVNLGAFQAPVAGELFHGVFSCRTINRLKKQAFITYATNSLTLCEVPYDNT